MALLDTPGAAALSAPVLSRAAEQTLSEGAVCAQKSPARDTQLLIVLHLAIDFQWDRNSFHKGHHGSGNCRGRDNEMPQKSRNQLAAFRAAHRDGAGLLLNVSCWLWVRAQSKSCILKVPVLIEMSHRSLLAQPQPSLQREQKWDVQGVPKAKVGVDLLEMQECQKSDIWSCNFYFSSTDTIRTFQAVY
ncbi:hypothetical protein EK904_001277 [Melospiza melodia maxima]|nr:hypothetical protein EK904_001277 [Melospiza melodia maxima]